MLTEELLSASVRCAHAGVSGSMLARDAAAALRRACLEPPNASLTLLICARVMLKINIITHMKSSVSSKLLRRSLNTVFPCHFLTFYL